MRRLRRRNAEEHEEHVNESWLIPYADLLTLLLALFIVLYSASNIDASKYQALMESFQSELTGTKIQSPNAGLSPTPPTVQPPVTTPEQSSKEETELNLLKQKLEKYITENQLQAVITLQDTKRGVEISLKDVILFDPGKADLKESSFSTLNVLVGLAKTISNPVNIEGHTDNVPIGNAAFASNWELSSARAVSVLHYFEANEIAKNRLQFTGYGEYHPVAPNDTIENRQANRRVNIVILRIN